MDKQDLINTTGRGANSSKCLLLREWNQTFWIASDADYHELLKTIGLSYLRNEEDDSVPTCFKDFVHGGTYTVAKVLKIDGTQRKHAIAETEFQNLLSKIHSTYIRNVTDGTVPNCFQDLVHGGVYSSCKHVTIYETGRKYAVSDDISVDMLLHQRLKTNEIFNIKDGTIATDFETIAHNGIYSKFPTDGNSKSLTQKIQKKSSEESKKSKRFAHKAGRTKVKTRRT